MASLIFITREDAQELSDRELIDGLIELYRRQHTLNQDDIELRGNIEEAYKILHEVTINLLEAGRQAIAKETIRDAIREHYNRDHRLTDIAVAEGQIVSSNQL